MGLNYSQMDALTGDTKHSAPEPKARGRGHQRNDWKDPEELQRGWGSVFNSQMHGVTLHSRYCVDLFDVYSSSCCS